MSELAQAIEEMRNMRESYDQLAATADLYQQGRTALASAITAKGVPTTADTPLADMAENVGDIQQVTTTIDGGDMYAPQLFGDGALWNLYEVLAQMKSQFMGAGHYAALIVCEYYKGYDSLQLQGADAYYTCDGDFYDYGALHTWHDAENGKSNRWVCFLYQQEGSRLDITNTAISPRSMYIGGHIGTIEYLVNGRLTELVCGVEETDVIDNFITRGYTQAWGLNILMRNIDNIPGISVSNAGAVVIPILTLNPQSSAYAITASNAVGVYFPRLKSINHSTQSIKAESAVALYLPELERKYTTNERLFSLGTATKLVYMPKLVSADGNNATRKALSFGAICPNIIDVWVGEFNMNLTFHDWNPTNVLADSTKKATLVENVKNHILARIADRSNDTRLTCTLVLNMYNAIANENVEWNGETMTLADAFLTKNWLLAGA